MSILFNEAIFQAWRNLVTEPLLLVKDLSFCYFFLCKLQLILIFILLYWDNLPHFYKLLFSYFLFGGYKVYIAISNSCILNSIFIWSIECTFFSNKLTFAESCFYDLKGFNFRFSFVLCCFRFVVWWLCVYWFVFLKVPLFGLRL